MGLTQSIRVEAERKQLTDDFKIKQQEFEISYIIPWNIFSAIEYQINKNCKSLEKFIVRAYVSVEPKLVYNKTHVKQIFNVEIEDITDYQGIVITKGPIEIKV